MTLKVSNNPKEFWEICTKENQKTYINIDSTLEIRDFGCKPL